MLPAIKRVGLQDLVCFGWSLICEGMLSGGGRSLLARSVKHVAWMCLARIGKA